MKMVCFCEKVHFRFLNFFPIARLPDHPKSLIYQPGREKLIIEE